MARFDEKRILITGGTSGMGRGLPGRIESQQKAARTF